MQYLMELLGMRELIEWMTGTTTGAIDAVDAWISRVEQKHEPVDRGMDAAYQWLLWALMAPLEHDPKAKKTS